MSNTHRWTSAAILLAAASTIPAQSQSVDSVRIRLAGTNTVVAQGQLVGRAEEKLVIRAYGQSADYAVAPDYTVERYHSGRATAAGALVLGGLGAIVGFTMTPPDEDKCDNSKSLLCNDIPAGPAVLYTVGGFAVGAGVGALLGSLIKRKKWSGMNPRDLPDNGPAISLDLAPGKVGLALRLRW